MHPGAWHNLKEEVIQKLEKEERCFAEGFFIWISEYFLFPEPFRLEEQSTHEREAMARVSGASCWKEEIWKETPNI